MSALLSRRQLLTALAFLLLVSAADVCLAQGGRYRPYGGRYSSPYGPTLSPYLDYFRRDTGVLDPYNTFIRPRRQLQNQLADIVQQEQSETARLQQQIQGIREAEARPTGTGATFLNYSHYYRTGPTGYQARRR
jgi:ATP phosphoribosyltransferase regulatory subunit HisZ